MTDMFVDLADMDYPPSWDMLGRVETEIQEQDETWGEQNHPLVGGRDLKPSKYEAQADRWKRVNDDRVRLKTLGWDGILLEEVFEALGEADPALQVKELVQVAAVAIQTAMSIERNQPAAE